MTYFAVGGHWRNPLRDASVGFVECHEFVGSTPSMALFRGQRADGNVMTGGQVSKSEEDREKGKRMTECGVRASGITF